MRRSWTSGRWLPSAPWTAARAAPGQPGARLPTAPTGPAATGIDLFFQKDPGRVAISPHRSVIARPRAEEMSAGWTLMASCLRPWRTRGWRSTRRCPRQLRGGPPRPRASVVAAKPRGGPHRPRATVVAAKPRRVGLRWRSRERAAAPAAWDLELLARVEVCLRTAEGSGGVPDPSHGWSVTAGKIRHCVDLYQKFGEIKLRTGRALASFIA